MIAPDANLLLYAYNPHGPRHSLDDALAIVDKWLSLPHVSILYPGDNHWRFLKRISLEAQAPANLFPDTVLVAIAVEYGATIHTNDRGFARFPGLRWENPLQA